MVDTVLKVAGLKFSYSTGAAALGGLDIEIFNGETVAIVGANGSGKTTLFKVVMGILKPYTGRVELLGRNIYHMTIPEIARAAGLVLQNPDVQLFSQTVRNPDRKVVSAFLQPQPGLVDMKIDGIDGHLA